ncbi:DUF4340 domain-containing protein [Caldichromatium japonicum]|uniref:DUF4340 domain-containing protein n=1 Tax=Caldichromatium japonicum TaxID=2699430 RepID=A0A6G7VCH3_9GAMM|nr:DUF4340 domain-containing protein [Caldichromatium japonicum]QIK37576.1 DUF4340 domain-containing protein [Caldichromatium japonicum]
MAAILFSKSSHDSAELSPAGVPDLGWRQDLRSPWVIGLAGLLVLQLLIALGLSLSAPSERAFAPQTPLIAFKPEQVKAIQIEGANGTEPVRLERRESTWIIGGLGDFPAASHRVDQLLNALADLKRPLPVANSAEARSRFKIADQDFKRRLTLIDKDGPLGTLILGETPSFKRLYGRPADDPAVYELPLAIADVSNRREDWVDKEQLRLDAEQIQDVSASDWRIAKEGSGWRLVDAAAGEQLDQEKVRELIQNLANLGYRDVLGTADDPSYNQSSPLLELKIQLNSGQTKVYRLSKMAEREEYVLKDSDRPYYFRLSKYDLGSLDGLDRSSLLVQTKPAKQEGPASGSSTPPAPAAE